MVIPLTPEQAVLVSVLAWSVVGVVSGFVASRLPLAFCSRETWLTRHRRWEHGGRLYERRFRIRAWKDRVPELGDLFPGGASKRHLNSRSTSALQRFAAETRRAELVHWVNAVSGPIHLLWCPPLLGAVMVAFGWAAHLPFIVIQRYNRARLHRVLARRRRCLTAR